jgi:hypothetical protein
VNSSSSFITLARRPEVVLTALKIAAVVGTILCLINQAPAMVSQQFSGGNVLQMLLTYLVPYCVSTYSSVKMIRRYSDS